MVSSKNLNLDTAVSKYFSTLKDILDDLHSEKVVRIHQRPSDVWFDEECKFSKCITRKLERKYLRSRSTADREAWFKQKNLHKLHHQAPIRTYQQKREKAAKLRRREAGVKWS